MTTKYLLSEKELPTRWYNIQADFKTPLPPPLHPGTGQPIGPADLAPLFPMELIKQEVSQERWIEIPDEVRDILRLWRPTPLYRARRLERAPDTPARIFYKYEGVSPAGSHKPNTAVAQAYYNREEKVARLYRDQPVRPRLPRSLRVRGLSRRPTAGLRVPGREGAGGPPPPPEGEAAHGKMTGPGLVGYGMLLGTCHQPAP
jgi:hypothetical protein